MKNQRIKPPVAVHVVWHRSDAKRVRPILLMLEKTLLRDVSCPFSRSVNIPLYYYTTDNVRLTGALDKPLPRGIVNLIVVLLSPGFVGAEGGCKYLQSLPKSGTIVPIWLDQRVGKIGNASFDSLNAIRLYDFPEDYRDRWGALLIAHEVYRRGFGVMRRGQPGKSSSVKLFLSHAKADAACEKLVIRIIKLIQQTNLSQFYDKTEISPGFRFDAEIERHIVTSTVIAFRGDHYASRYWCQREILTAKKNNRPIVVCDMLESSEDRHFIPLSNVPSIRINNSDVGESEILDLLLSAIRETIRCSYIEVFLKQWMSAVGEKKCVALVRPPEAGMLIGQNRKVCYPDPPLYEEELKWCTATRFYAVTPLWNPRRDKSAYNCLHVGISASEPNSCGCGKILVNGELWKRLAQDIARHVLIRSGAVIYGGDMRKGGVTESLLEEAARLKGCSDVKSDIRPIVNFLAWPLHLYDDEESAAWRNRYGHVLDTRCLPPVMDLGIEFDTNVFLPPTTPENCFVWSKCLSAMREQMIRSCDTWICVGGRSTGYTGCMPGLLEEVLIAIKNHVPVYLLGGFGGVVGQVCSLIKGSTATEINEIWQIENNTGYATLLKMYKSRDIPIDYEKIQAQLRSLTIKELSMNSGLTSKEYAILMESDYVEECVYLLNRGLKNVAVGRKRKSR